MTDDEYLAQVVSKMIDGPTTNAKLKEAVGNLAKRLGERSTEARTLRHRLELIRGFATPLPAEVDAGETTGQPTVQLSPAQADQIRAEIAYRKNLPHVGGATPTQGRHMKAQETDEAELIALAAIVAHDAAMQYSWARQYGEAMAAPDFEMREELRRRMVARLSREPATPPETHDGE